MKKLASFAILLFLYSQVFTQVTAYEHIPETQRATVKQWIATLPQYRPALISDIEDQQFLDDARAEQLGSFYQPFFAQGDFNIDGTEDFAVAIVRSGVPVQSFDLAIFHGLAKGGFNSRPTHRSSGYRLNIDGLVTYGRGPSRLSVSSLGSWHATVFTWRKVRYVTRYE